MANSSMVFELVGIVRATADPEIRYLDSGVPVCSIPAVANRVWTDAEGNRQSKPFFIRITAWRDLGEAANAALHKGSRFFVKGTPTASAWLTQEGQARATLEVEAQQLVWLDPRPGQGEQTDDVPFTE